LERETAVVIANRDFYVPRTEDEESRYWCSLWVDPKPPDNPPKENILSVICGDFIHNLRSALNYIVVALVDKSGANLTKKHQFPIFEDQASYEGKIWDTTTAIGRGDLGNVIYGLREIYDLQPFRKDPKFCVGFEPGQDPMSAHPLFHLNRLSNADKHRLLANLTPIPDDIVITERDGKIVDTVWLDRSDWKTHVTRKVARLLIKADATEVHIETKIGMSIWFGTPSFPKGGSGYSINLPECTRMCETVDAIVNAFKCL
jgi:hypothetical protein